MLFAGPLCLALIILGCGNDRLTAAPVSPNILGNWGSDSLRYYLSFSDAVNPGDAKSYVTFDLGSVNDTSLHHSAERGTWSISKSINGGGTWNTKLADELILDPVSCVDSLGTTQACVSMYSMTVRFSSDASQLILTRGTEEKTLGRVW